MFRSALQTLPSLGWGQGVVTFASGAHGGRGFHSHVVPPQAGPQQPQHEADPSQRAHSLETVPARPTSPRYCNLTFYRFAPPPWNKSLKFPSKKRRKIQMDLHVMLKVGRGDG